MTMMHIEKRVKALEATVQQLALAGRGKPSRWYRTYAGRFAADASFDEIVKLGRAYRKSQRGPSRQS